MLSNRSSARKVFRMNNWSQNSRKQYSNEQDLRKGELVQGGANATPRQPGLIPGLQCSSSPSSSNTPAKSYYRETTIPDDKHESSEKNPTRVYDQNGAETSDGGKPPPTPPKDLLQEVSQNPGVPRKALNQPQVERTIFHGPAGDLEHRVLASNDSGKIDLSSEQENLRPSTTEAEWRPELDAQNLKKFRYYAWRDIERERPMVLQYNARSSEREHIDVAFTVSHRLLWSKIKKLLHVEFELHRKIRILEDDVDDERKRGKRNLEKASLDHKESEERREREYEASWRKRESEHTNALEQANITNKNELDRQARTYTNQIAELEVNYGARISKKDETILAWKIAKETQEEMLREEFQAILDEKNEEISRRETSFEEERNRFARGQEELRNQKDQEIAHIEREHRTHIEDMKKEYDELLEEDDRQLAELKDTHVRELRERQLVIEATAADRDEKIAKLENAHACDMQRLEDGHAAQVQQYETTIDTLNDKHERRMLQQEAEHTNKMTHLQTNHAAKQEQLVQLHRNKENKMIGEHERASQTLVEEVHALNKVLLTRNNEAYLPPILSEADLKHAPDEYVKAKFQEIVQDVEVLSRLVWKSDQKVWTDEILHDIGGKQNVKQGQRMLKKSILQDTIWTIVFQHIFCSPFRMFGKEGKVLEQEWNRWCNQDPNFDNGIYTWPSLEIETERWRYITLKECRKALVGPVPSQFDPRAKLKVGFKMSKDAFVADLKTTVSSIIEWEGSDATDIDKLANRLLNFWLECGMYRCRFMVYFKAGGMAGLSAKEKVEKLKSDSTLELNVVPGLRRHGNVKGVELSRVATVGGFDGECVKIGL